jgi:hypothetical protein
MGLKDIFSKKIAHRQFKTRTMAVAERTRRPRAAAAAAAAFTKTTKRTTTASNSSLPCWAQLVRPRAHNAASLLRRAPLSPLAQVSYLRTHLFQAWRAQWNTCRRDTMLECMVQPILDCIMREKDTTNSVENDDDVAKWMILPPPLANHDCKVTLLHDAPAHVVDRRQCCGLLVEKLSQFSSVVWLQHASSLSSSSQQHPWRASQAWIKVVTHLTGTSSSNANASATERLRHAGSGTCWLVLDVTTAPPAAVTHFLHWLEQTAVPRTLLLVTAASAASCYWPTVAAVETHAWPSVHAWWTALAWQYWGGHCIDLDFDAPPPPLPSAAWWAQQWHAFQEQHQAVAVAEQAVLHYLATAAWQLPTGELETVLPLELRPRVAACLNVPPNDDHCSPRQSLQATLVLMHQVLQAVTGPTATPWLFQGHDHHQPLTPAQRVAALTVLQQWKQALQENGHSPSPLLRTVLELVIVTSRVQSVAELAQCAGAYQAQHDDCHDEPPQPRRDTVRGWLESYQQWQRQEEDGKDDGAVSVDEAATGLLLELLRHRFAIGQQEWFQRFAAVLSTLPKRDLPYLFQCGINNLRVSGLIREVRDGLVYEKAAVVWCQNDD